jgi:phosphate uptake regulator
MRLLNRGLYKIEHFNDFFHFKLKVRSLAVGARMAARAHQRFTSLATNIASFLVYLGLGLLLGTLFASLVTWLLVTWLLG